MTDKKGIFVLIFISILVLSSTIMSAEEEQFTAGSGTNQDPYQIETCEQLQNVKNFNDKSFILIRDIDCSDTGSWNNGEGFQPISGFGGKLNGNGFAILDLYINRESHVGLFSSIAKGHVYDLGIINPNMTSKIPGGKIGGVVGEMTTENSLVEGVYVKGGKMTHTKSSPIVGGVVGNLRAGTLKDCYSQNVVQNVGYGGGPGGISGDMRWTGVALIDKCYSAIDGKHFLGSYNNGAVSNSFCDETLKPNCDSIGNKAEGKPTSELQDIDTFTNLNTPGLDEVWDMVPYQNYNDETWFIKNNEYPQLGFEEGFGINLVSPRANAGFSENLILFEVEILDLNSLGIQKVQLWIDGNLVPAIPIINGGDYSFSKTLSNGIHTWKIKVKDNNGDLWESKVEKTLTILNQDNNPPVFSEVKHDDTLAGGKTTFSIKWDDELLQSDGQWVFSINNANTWIDDAPINFVATPAEIEVKKILNPAGGTIEYKWFAVDNFGNSVQTPIYSFDLVVPDPNAVLPQTSDWRVILRNYMKTLDESDFDVSLQPITYDNSWFNSPDEVYRLWSALVNRAYNFPELNLQDSSIFLLDNIEANNQVNMRSAGEMSPVTMAFYADWDYEGNPYYQNENLMRRAFAVAAVDMIMPDWPYSQMVYTSGYFLKHAYVYSVVKDVLPEDIKLAYEKGLKEKADRIFLQSPQGANSDMTMPLIPGLWYFYDSIDDPIYKEKALTFAKKILSPESKGGTIKPSGVLAFAGGIDSSYNGIALNFITWGALASHNDPNWKFASERLEEMTKLRSYLILQEPPSYAGIPPRDRAWSPSHFNPRTPMDANHDQWVREGIRTIGAFMNSWMLGSQEGIDEIYTISFPPYVEQGIVGEPQMRLDNKANINKVKNKNKESAYVPIGFGKEHWIHERFYTLYFTPGDMYGALEYYKNTNSDYTKRVFNRQENFIKKFPENEDGLAEHEKKDFLTAKFDDYGAIIYTGRTGYFPGIILGGGGLSAFWTEETGSVILGRSGGHDVRPQVWSEIFEWPTHALSGKTANGKGFSSARLDRLGIISKMDFVDYTINGNDNALIKLQGPIGTGITKESEELNGNAKYGREIYLNEKWAIIETKITSDGTDEVSELYEILPIFLGSSPAHMTKANVSIHFYVGGNYIPAVNQLTDEVEKIKINRYNGTVYIIFDSERKVKLQENIWDCNGCGAVQNIMIDMLEGNNLLPEETSVRYIISANENTKPTPWVSFAVPPPQITPQTIPPEQKPANITPAKPVRNANQTEEVSPVETETITKNFQEAPAVIQGAIINEGFEDSSLTEREELTDEETALLDRGDSYGDDLFQFPCNYDQRKGNEFCNFNGEWEKQKKTGEMCEYDYQCKSNECSTNQQCSRMGFFNWFRGIFN